MPSRSRFLASHTKPGPNIELAVARKSIFKDSTEEQVSMMSLANLSGMAVVVGDWVAETSQMWTSGKEESLLLTTQLKKKWLLWAIEA